MRRTYNSGLLFTDDGQFLGVNLGADYCAEHEYGIKKIKNDFNIEFVSEKPKNTKTLLEKVKGIFKNEKEEDLELFGIDKRIIRKVSEGLCFLKYQKQKKTHYVLYARRGYMVRFEQGNTEVPTKPALGEKETYAAWDEEEFIIIVRKENKKHLEELYKAFQDLDVAIGFGGGGPFENPGLKLIIASKLPEEVKTEMFAMDYDNYILRKTAKETGIHEVLKNAGKKYYALSPKWSDEKKTEIQFWLNPMDQQNNNYGWYTIEELKQWANNEGPIPMKKTV